METLDRQINQTAHRSCLSLSRLIRAAVTIAVSPLSILAMISMLTMLTMTACAKPPATAAPAQHAERKTLDEPSRSLPSDLYKTMPVYPGATVEHVRTPTGAMREILFSSNAPMQQLAGYYKEALKKNNFHVTSSLIMPARRTWSCDFHYDGRPGSITLFPSDQDKSRMTIDLIYELPAKIDQSLLEPKEDFDVIGPGEIAQQTLK